MVKSCVTSRDAVPPLPIFCEHLSSVLYSIYISAIRSAHATVSGKTVYVSGSIGCDKDFKLVGGLEEQTVSLCIDILSRTDKMLLSAQGLTTCSRSCDRPGRICRTS